MAKQKIPRRSQKENLRAKLLEKVQDAYPDIDTLEELVFVMVQRDAGYEFFSLPILQLTGQQLKTILDAERDMYTFRFDLEINRLIFDTSILPALGFTLQGKPLTTPSSAQEKVARGRDPIYLPRRKKAATGVKPAEVVR